MIITMPLPYIVQIANNDRTLLEIYCECEEKALWLYDFYIMLTKQSTNFSGPVWTEFGELALE